MANYIQSIDDLHTIHLHDIGLCRNYIVAAKGYLESLLFFNVQQEVVIEKLLEDLNETIDICRSISRSKPFSPDIPGLRPHLENIRAKVFVIQQYLCASDLPPDQHPVGRQVNIFEPRQRISKVRLF